MQHPALVLTSIAPDSHPILRQLVSGAHAAGWRCIVVGDIKSPDRFSLPGCEFLSVQEQLAWGERHTLRFARACPTKHYARKNIGYLEAIRAGAPVIVETDDDNLPKPRPQGADSPRDGEHWFWGSRTRARRVGVVDVPMSVATAKPKWVNAYHYFVHRPSPAGEPTIWPRGMALDAIHRSAPLRADAPVREVSCPIQQGLADDNPDVDAIYRLCRALPFTFDDAPSIALGAGAWCPFNSQNTTWFPEVFPLLYLPALCSFRMTDIWRSFVAQRVCWANDWPILFHRATLRQERNDHNLMRDFEDEVSGYTKNDRIASTLAALDLPAGAHHVAANLHRCYHVLVAKGFFPTDELVLVEAWLHDLGRVTSGVTNASIVETKPTPSLGVGRPS